MSIPADQIVELSPGGVDCFIFTVSGADPREGEMLNLRRESILITDKIEDYLIFPYAGNERLPELIQEVVYNNYIAPGLLTKKTNLLWGNGPKLYKESFAEDGTPIREYLEDEDIQSWLDSIDYKDYLLQLAVDYHYIESASTKIHLNAGQTKIHSLEHIPAADLRLAIKPKRMKDGSKVKPTHAVLREYKVSKGSIQLTQVGYPMFNPLTPFENPQTVVYSKKTAFNELFYSLPDIFGSLEWLRRSTAIPLLFRALIENGMNVKYHVESPSIYWVTHRKRIQDECTKNGIEYTEKMFKEFEKEVFKKITDTLSGTKNTGKLWHTVKIYDSTGTDLIEAGWTIKPIEQNVKEFIDSYIKLSERADYAVASGIQIHSALGGIGQSGKSDSGSEQLYAIKTYLGTSVNIPEMVICRALNYALAVNWPGKKIKIGFQHNTIQREQDITSSKRVTNNETL